MVRPFFLFLTQPNMRADPFVLHALPDDEDEAKTIPTASVDVRALYYLARLAQILYDSLDKNTGERGLTTYDFDREVEIEHLRYVVGRYFSHAVNMCQRGTIVQMGPLLRLIEESVSQKLRSERAHQRNTFYAD